MEILHCNRCFEEYSPNSTMVKQFLTCVTSRCYDVGVTQMECFKDRFNLTFEV